MIRINLLEVRPRSAERLDSILSTGRSSTFISRREAVLGALFLVLTVVILGVLVSRFSDLAEEDAEAVAAETAPEPPSPAEVVSQPEVPEPAVSEPVAPEPVIPEPADSGSQPAPPSEPKQAEPPAAALAPSAAGTLTAIRATALEDRVDVFLEMANPSKVSSFRIENPPRLVFDIPGTLAVADSRRSQAIESPLVQRVRIAQNRFDPPLVRLVLEVADGPLQSDFSTSAAGISIHVTPKP